MIKIKHIYNNIRKTLYNVLVILREKHNILWQNLEHNEIEPEKALKISNELYNSANFLVIGDYELRYGNKYINERETIIKSQKDLANFVASGKNFIDFGYIIVTDFKLYQHIKNNFNLSRIKVIDFIGKTSNLDKEFPVYEDIFNHFYFFPFYNQYIARYITNCKEKMFYLKTTGDDQYIEINLENGVPAEKILFGTGDEKTNSSYFDKTIHISYYYDEFSDAKQETDNTKQQSIPVPLEKIQKWISKSDTLLLKYAFNYLAPFFVPVSSKYDFIRGSYLLNKLEEDEIIRSEEIDIRPTETTIVSSKTHLYENFDEFIPMYNLKHLNDTFLDEKNYDFVKVSDEIKETYAIHKNDILISIRGTSFKTAFVVEEPKTPAIISSNICILRNKDKNYPLEDMIGDYIFIKSATFKDFIDYLSPNSSSTNLNTKIFDNLYVPPFYSEVEKENFRQYREYMELTKNLKEGMESIETFVFRQDLLMKSSNDK